MTITYYELLEDNTIGMSTPFADVAASLGLTLTTEKEIVYAWNGKRYFKGEEPIQPPPPPPTKEEIRELRAKAFTEEADPLKFNYEEASARYGATSKEAVEAKLIWLEKKDEIRERYPYPDEKE